LSRKLETCEDYAASFWSKTQWEGNCLIWQRAVNEDGYGIVLLNGKPQPAHRVAWLLVYGAFPKNEACHTCDKPACVRPDHLFDGTHRENMIDASKKGRMAKAGTKLAKLTRDDIPLIHHMHKNGLAYRTIGKVFSVDESTIRACINGRTWRGNAG
jgi:hypothetical protein